MRTAILVLSILTFKCLSAQADVFKSRCIYDDARANDTFFIVVDSIKKTGLTDYHNPEQNIGLAKGKSKLELLSLQSFDGGLIGLKLSDHASGAIYRIDYIRAYLPAKSPYKPEDSSVAVSKVNNGTSHYSCRSE